MQCQKCRAHVHLDSSLENLNAASFKILTESAATISKPASTLNHPRHSRPAYAHERRAEYETASQQATSPVFRRTIQSNRSKDDGRKVSGADHPGMSFVMLSESQLQTPESATDISGRRKATKGTINGGGTGAEDSVGSTSSTHQTEVVKRLFEILSARSDIDHPICAECTELLVEGLQKRLNHATKERDAYVEFLRQTNADIPSEEEVQQAKQALASMKEKEEIALADLKKLEAEKAKLDEELRALELESQGLDKDEEEFWQERNAFSIEYAEFESQRDAINNKYEHDTRQLEKLQRTNVFNDTFQIGHDGHFGTINGLRLGKLSNYPVEWAEINAAWGQACLLLATVADLLGHSFQGYRLVPMGSTSTIERLEFPQAASTNDPAHPSKPKVSVLELYHHDSMALGFGFMHKKFDTAMVAFLECLRQLGEALKTSNNSRSASQDATPQLPYAIKKDKIHDTSIRFGFATEDAWTRACKYVLTCCKFLLAHASNMHNPTRHGS